MIEWEGHLDDCQPWSFKMIRGESPSEFTEYVGKNEGVTNI